MKVTVIPTVIGALGTGSKGLEKEIGRTGVHSDLSTVKINLNA